MTQWQALTGAALCLSLSGCLAPREDTAADETVPLHRAARPRHEIAGAPRASDVCMRSLVPRRAGEKNPHDTLAAIRGFHVTWLEWTYGNNREFIREVHDLGVTYGGALAAGSYSGDQPHETWNVRDREGNPVYATWMRAWKRPNPWGCANHPEFRAGHVRAAVAAVEAGADVLQRDEPAQNQLAVYWGGCFCEHCMGAFRDWLRDNAEPAVLQQLGVTALDGFDYRDYLRKRDAPVGDGPVQCRVGLQAADAPHKVLAMRVQAIDAKVRRYTLKGQGLNEGDATDYLVQFDVGAAENAGRTLWLDDVRLAVLPAP